MTFSRNKSFITRNLRIADFVERYIGNNKTAMFPNRFRYKDSGVSFNIKDNGRNNISDGLNSKKDILAEINKPEVYIPDDTYTKPKYDRVYLNYEYHLDDLFNIIICDYDKPCLSVNTFAEKISKEAHASGNHPEIEFSDGTLGTIVKTIEHRSHGDKLVDKIKFLSKAIDIKIQGIYTWTKIL